MWGYKGEREERRDWGGNGGETRFQVFHRLNEEQTCTIQDSEGEKIIIWRWKAEREGERFIHCHTAVLFARCWETTFFLLPSKRMKRFFWSQKGLLSFLGSLSGSDVISINYLPAPKRYEHASSFLLFTLNCPIYWTVAHGQQTHTRSEMHTGQQADTSQIGHEWYTELSAKQH